MARCWIFQSNPKIFDIIAELKYSDDLSHWTIRQHQDDVKYGDTAFIWKASAGEGDPGIYAVAKIISDVVPLPVIWGDEYWMNPTDIKVEPRVLIRYTKKLVHDPILERKLVRNPVLKDLEILTVKARNRTVFSVTDTQCQELNKIIP